MSLTPPPFFCTVRRAMRLPSCLVAFALSIATVAYADEKKFSAADIQFFESKIRPILVEHCYDCHSTKAGTAEGGLLLDSREAIVQGGNSGPAVLVGNPRNSLLVKAIEYNDADFAMPPEESGGKLSSDQIASIAEWIKRGLPDPRKRTTSKRDAEDYHEIKEWWSFQPMKQSDPPASSKWSWNDVDRFIEGKLKEQDLRPVADASPETLVRRVTFDLTGLPPTISQIENFQQQCKSQGLRTAYEAYVDQLLNSSAYSEQFARHWLDVARFAESTGREVNIAYPVAWRYRNWVIDAFAADKPYDQFLREQIAGDLLPAASDERRAENQIATGFLAVGSRSINEMSQKQFAVDQADEQIDATFQATMALTVSCARCHDHKFDPIPQDDYTAVSGIFLSTKTHFGSVSFQQARNNSDFIVLSGDHKQPILHSAVEPSVIDANRKKFDTTQEELRTLNQEMAKLKRSNGGTSNAPAKTTQNLIQKRNRLTSKLQEIESFLELYDEKGQPLALVMGVSDKPARTETLVNATRNNAKKKMANPLMKAMQSKRAGFESISDSPLFTRGDIEMPSEPVHRGVLTTIGTAPSFDVPESASGRLQLSRWITRPNNSFTARVAVNRVWTWLIGQGLVTSVDNFGTSGSTPSHPELLDHLALRFVEEGWSTKKLVRWIVTSHTYQLASTYNEKWYAKDPDNVYLWRMNSRRLTGESIRDSILMMTDQLELKPPLASPVADVGNGRIDRYMNREQKKNDSLDPSLDRSLYLGLVRGGMPEILEIFDATEANVVQSKRDATNVPSQSLYLLNSPWVSEKSKLFAEVALQKFPGPIVDRFEERLTMMYQMAYARPPKPEEVVAAKKLLDATGPIPNVAWSSLARGIMAAAEFRYVD